MTSFFIFFYFIDLLSRNDCSWVLEPHKIRAREKGLKEELTFGLLMEFEEEEKKKVKAALTCKHVARSPATNLLYHCTAAKCAQCNDTCSCITL